MADLRSNKAPKFLTRKIKPNAEGDRDLRFLLFFPEDFHRRDTQVVVVSKEPHCLSLASSRLTRFHPLAPPHALPHALEKPNRAAFDIGLIVLSHDSFDGFGSFTGMVEWDGGNSMVQNVRFDDVVEEVVTDKAKVPVHCGCSSTYIVPCLWLVMGQRRISVM